MLEKLFGSRARVSILDFFLTQPDREFHIRGLAQRLNLKINSVRRELLNLKKIGLLKSRKEKNREVFYVNKDFIIWPELSEIFHKLGKPKEDISDILQKAGKIKLAVLTGKFTKAKDAPVDLLLVGEVNKQQLSKVLGLLAEEIKDEVVYALFSEKEYQFRQMCHDKFLIEVFSSPHKVVIDKIKEKKI